jgi:hypothetical protein
MLSASLAREITGMIEIGIFQNGASDLQVVTTKNGVVVNDGSLAEVHQGAQRTLINQIRQGVLGDQLDFNYFFMTEHHFQPEGAEYSPNPLLVLDPGLVPSRRPVLHDSAGFHPLEP